MTTRFPKLLVNYPLPRMPMEPRKLKKNFRNHIIRFWVS